MNFIANTFFSLLIIIPIIILIYSSYIKINNKKDKSYYKILKLSFLKTPFIRILEISSIVITIWILWIYTKDTYYIRVSTEEQYITSIRPAIFPIYNNNWNIWIKNFSNWIAQNINILLAFSKDNWGDVWSSRKIWTLSPLSENNFSTSNIDTTKIWFNSESSQNNVSPYAICLSYSDINWKQYYTTFLLSGNSYLEENIWIWNCSRDWKKNFHNVKVETIDEILNKI